IIDDILTARNARSIATQVIARMGPYDLAAVVFTRDNRHAQDFTSDKAKLRAAVERFSPGTAFIDPTSYQPQGLETSVNTDVYAFQSSVRTISEAADYLAAAPNRRKALVYISEGVPVDFELAATPNTQEVGAVHKDLILDMLDAYRRAQRANVAVYS